MQAWSWRAVFGLNVALAGLAMLGVLRFIPESANPDAPRLDLLGSVLTVAGLGVLVYSIIEAPTQGWASARTLGGFTLGVVVLIGFIGWELTRTHPCSIRACSAIGPSPRAPCRSACSSSRSSAVCSWCCRYLQLVRGNSPLVAAVSLIPMALAMMPAARLIAPA